MAEVRWTDRAEKDLRRLDARQRERVVTAVLDLAAGGHGDVSGCRRSILRRFACA